MIGKLVRAARNPRLYTTVAAAKFMERVGKPDFAGVEAVRSVSDDGSYVRVVKKAASDSAAFAQFKRNPLYMRILEHVSQPEGQQYLDILQRDYPDLLQAVGKFKANDLVGNPVRFDYPMVGTISPTTLRYMKVAGDIRARFGNLSGFDVAEIGAGYGGQALVIDRAWQTRTYTMFDLDPVLSLISRYLECHLLRTGYRVSTLNRFVGGESFDLAISNYAFSELPADLQRVYIEKVLRHAERGYLTMNSGKPGCPSNGSLKLDELRELLPSFEILEERPITAQNNYILVWG